MKDAPATDALQQYSRISKLRKILMGVEEVITSIKCPVRQVFVF